MTRPNKRWAIFRVGALLACLVISIMAFFSHIQDQSLPQNHLGPWVLGPPSARWTITEFADLECPYCKTYTPVLKSWVQRQKDVNLQWHHLPLGFHGAVAVHEARRAECAGKLGGPEAFWQAVDQTFERTHSNGQGFDGHLDVAGIDSSELESCSVNDMQVALHVDQQSREATSFGVEATPSLMIRDNTTGKTVKLEGPADGVTLLSAIDWLASNSNSVTTQR
ncbi:DsbA family protein [Pseudomonas gingeri]|uniref:DsbA family protein n=1 Tax=Pseudomonas gingeri TaxID=117681 RepID=A0A7Y7X9Z2_9PSED|nr:thioredoxin domain-containing protein [Pseudomonas gingeri]NWB94813.1 DsbA family protein [Pseudomonas gingeri]